MTSDHRPVIVDLDLEIRIHKDKEATRNINFTKLKVTKNNRLHKKDETSKRNSS